MGRFVMMVTSVRVSTLRLAVVLFALAAIVGVALWPVHGTVAVVSNGLSYQGISDNTARVAFLSRFGWKVDPSPEEVVEITVPESFDAVYRRYNQMQKEQGLDLMPYRGKRVKRWTYTVKNYPNYDGTVYADLLIENDDLVVAGDVRTVSVNGFIQGLKRPGSKAASSGMSPASADITSGLFGEH